MQPADRADRFADGNGLASIELSAQTQFEKQIGEYGFILCFSLSIRPKKASARARDKLKHVGDEKRVRMR